MAEATPRLRASVIDVNASIGPDVPSGRSTDGASVLAGQNRYGIGHSLVRSSAAIRVSREAGNRSVLELGDPTRMSAVVSASILHGDRLEAELSAAGAAGARGAWVEHDRWHEDTEALRRLVAAAGRTGLPMLVPHRGPGDASRIGEATADAGIPVVIVEARYAAFSEVIPALERYDHLHLETSSLGSYQAIEAMTGVIGHERILYGSGTPVGTPLSPIYAVLMAELSVDAKRAILSGNAARLFDLADVSESDLRVPIPERLFDVHGHFFPAPWEVPDQPATSMLAELSRFGLRKQVASSVPAIMGDLEAGNRQTVDACGTDPNQLGYLVAHPHDVDLAAEHIRRWGDAPGIVGIKVHAEGSGVPTGAVRMGRLFDLLADFGRPVKIHNAGPDWPGELLSIARAHPTLPIIIAHAGYHRPELSSAAIVNGTPNVHLELASSKADIREARDLVDAVDPTRVMFGADAPLLNPAFVLGVYEDLGLQRDVLEAVYWQHGERLFGDYL